MAKRKRQRRWYLLFRKEEGQRVHLYEPLHKYELQARKRNGWKVES